MTFKIISDELEPYKKTAFYLTPSYKKTDAKGYKGKGYGFDLGLAGNIDDANNISLSINYLKNKNEFKYSKIDSDQINANLNHIVDLKSFKILSGLGLGFGKNDLERNIALNANNIKGSYKNLIISAQIGLAKDYDISDFTITPLLSINHSFIKQDDFKENGKVLAKNHTSIKHNTTSVMAGASATYAIKSEKTTSQFMAYALYDYRLSGKNFDNKVSFADFNNDYFKQKYELDKSVFRLGTSYQVNFANGFFARLGLGSEFASNKKAYEVSSTLGYKF